MRATVATFDVMGRVLLSVLLAAAWLVVSGPPAGAVDDWRVTNPPSGTSVTGDITISASVTANALEVVEVVEVRLVSGGQQVGPTRTMEHVSGTPRSAGTSEWRTALRPLSSWATGGEAMANGRYRIEVRATSSVQGSRRHATDWRGHEVRFDVKPPAATVSAQVLSRTSRSVEVTWQAQPLPDFRRYVVQRAPASGSFSTLAELSAQSAARFVDIVPEYGTWRYRVATVRADADGQDLSRDSAEHRLTVSPPGVTEPEEPPSPGDPAPPPPGGEGGDGEPSPEDPSDDTPGEEPTDTDGDDAPGGNEDDDQAGGTNRSPRTLPTRRGSAGSPDVGDQSAPRLDASVRADQRPRVSQPDEGFEETLPYDVELERQITRREIVRDAAPRSGGVLTVGTRELVLEQVLTPVAGGLLLFVLAGHVLRLARRQPGLK